jgi:hypothetical protein
MQDVASNVRASEARYAETRRIAAAGARGRATL